LKLKLEANDKLKTLLVTESVSISDGLVIKAGIQKLFTDKNTSRIVLDFSEAQSLAPDLKPHLQSLCESAPMFDCTFLIAGSNPLLEGLATGKIAKEALAHFQNRPTVEILKERAQLLQTKIDRLKSIKAESEKKLTALSQDKNDPKRILKTTSDLKRVLSKLEADLTQKMPLRKSEPLPNPDAAGTYDHIVTTISAVLEAEGVLKNKGKA
jgi:hypothetical protein